MKLIKEKKIRIKNENDFLNGRGLVKELAEEIELSDLVKTKITTASSEILRNMLIHGKGGVIIIRIIEKDNKIGLEVICKDKGVGIPDKELALQKGFSTNKSLGLGLPGAKNLVDEFQLKSELNKGTVVKLMVWKQ
ncbi:anti-sigma regulatory factor [Flexithrix dorotheae]|uniref:anti-sigma regulatory factor n=1 Tax=Flexithrix dorotheae TaxID=70993 RepID=UPI000378DF46|nr:anti-sigma regulatory factor [Flexithrix dorotheae]